MSWFAKFFSNSNSAGVNPGTKVAEPSVMEDFNVLEDLFVNNEAPTAETEQKSSGHSIKPFLEFNWFSKGYQDGYEFHSTDMLIDNIKALKAEFRMNLNMKIDGIRNEILKLEDHKITTEGMSDRLTRQLENRIATSQAQITEIESEIAMSSIDEGLAMTVIHRYRDGYLRGVQAYQEEKLIAGSTGMFD